MRGKRREMESVSFNVSLFEEEGMMLMKDWMSEVQGESALQRERDERSIEDEVDDDDDSSSGKCFLFLLFDLLSSMAEEEEEGEGG